MFGSPRAWAGLGFACVVLGLFGCDGCESHDPDSEPKRDGSANRDHDGSQGQAGGGGSGASTGDAATDGGTREDAGDAAASDTIPPGCELPIDPTVATYFADAVSCLYTGDHALQTGTQPDAIDPQRVAVARGRVLDEAGAPLADVIVSVPNQPDVGQTRSRSDGRYDLALLGGGVTTLRFQKPGFLPVQRKPALEWQRFTVLPDVVLLGEPAVAGSVELAALAEPTFIRGPMERDADGARSHTLLFAPGTTATLERADGTSEPLGTVEVRIREYTVGERGPAAMPGTLPETSGYTYAVDFSVAGHDDASAVRFDPPLVSYVDNFLTFPAGTTVPTGYYDQARDVWAAAPSGVVLDVVGVRDGRAELDADGDGEPDDDESLAALGIEESERAAIASEYAAGASLWRVPIAHFSAWDCNWPFGPPAGAGAPTPSVAAGGADDCRTRRGGSIIGCEDQTLGEVLPISGTPFALHYQSERSAGRKDSQQLEIALTPDALPADVKRIELEVDVLGQLTVESFEPAPNLRHTYVWDGNDAYGRHWQGRQTATVRVGYTYDGAYQNAQRFGQVGDGTQVTGDRAREEITLWSEWRAKLGGFEQTGTGFGGWSLDAQHSYDPRGGTLFLGDGTRQTSERIGNVIDTVAGTGTAGFAGDGSAARAAELDGPHGIVVGPDGSVFISDELNHRVRKVAPDGTISTYAGSGASVNDGDGGAATAAGIYQPLGLALAPDGTLYVSSRGGRVRAVDPSGVIRTIAGGGSPDDGRGDGAPAVNAAFVEAHALTLGADGTLYVVDAEENTLRRIDTDGIITTVCGVPGMAGSAGDGGLASAATLNEPLGVAIGPDGSLFIAEWAGHRVRKIDASGIISTLAGTGSPGFSGDGGLASAAQLRSPHSVAVGPDGSVYITDEGNDRVRRVRPDGAIETVAGGGTELGDGGPPLAARFRLPRVVYFHRDGTLWIADFDDQRIRRVRPGLPGFSLNDIAIASSDGAQLYAFDDHGRHLRTLDALLGVTLLELDYDDGGLLIGVTDRDGNATAIERDSTGAARVVVGPYGERTALELDDRGYLQSATNAAGEATAMEYSDDGLLTRFEQPRAAEPDVHVFAYDELGRLIRDEGPTGLVQSLARQATASGAAVTVSQNDARPFVYELAQGTDGASSTRTQTDSAGLVNTTTLGTSSYAHSSPRLRDAVTFSGDPRFGLQVKLPATRELTFSGSRKLEQETTRTVSLADALDPLSVTTLVDTTVLNGRTSTRSWDRASRTWTQRTPAGRTQVTTLDAQGRVAQVQLGLLTPWIYAYDARGRLSSLSIGTRVYGFEYDAGGRLSAIIDPLARRSAFERDAVGRTTKSSGPGGEVSLGYDAAGDLVSLTPPGRAAHTFGYASGGQLTSHAPPGATAAAPTQIDYGYDTFDALASVRWPNADTLAFTYDPATGRPTRVQLPDEAIDVGYDATTGEISTLSRPGSTLTLGHSGLLLSSLRWSGEVTGSVDLGYDDDLRLIRDRFTTSIDYGYDDDGLIVSAGPETLERDISRGAVTAIVLGTVRETLAYDGLGELTDRSAAGASATLYSSRDTRDALGRVVQRSESVLGESHDYAYAYDAHGRLAQVQRDGSESERYGYDDNGNRLTASNASGSRNASHGADDRLLSDGPRSYEHNARGARSAMHDGAGTTAYRYDALGALRAVVLPDGRQIEYVVDGVGRRIGKKVDGVLVQQLFYRDALRPVAMRGAAGSALTRFVYGQNLNVPDAMIKDGIAYRLISDAVGSVRLVVNTSDDTVAQRIDYDAFGNVLVDTAPGFQPFGFAGGLYDADTGLVRLGARDYDAVTGRWTAKDPILFEGGTPNLYEYCGNDPVNRIDPSGLWAGGFSVDISTINPWTSGGGGTYGINVEYTSDAGWHVYTYGTPGEVRSAGFDIGVACTGNLATGEGDWTGAFDSWNGAALGGTIGFFHSPLSGPDVGYFGVQAGLSFGPPGLGGTRTIYED